MKNIKVIKAFTFKENDIISVKEIKNSLATHIEITQEWDDFGKEKQILVKFLLLQDSLKEKYNYSKISSKHITGELEETIDNLFEEVSANLMSLNPSSIIVSITDSKSIYFRIIEDNWVIHYECFFTKDYLNDEIEVVYSIYYNSNLFQSEKGNKEKAFNDLKKFYTEKIKHE